MEPLISIIVPIFNSKNTISRCLNSLAAQSIDNIEIIVIDDGSTDGSTAVVDQYILKDNRIRLISQKNAGQGAARNVGIKASRGRYLGFVDSDDYVDRDMYRLLFQAAEKHSTDIAFCQERNLVIHDGKIVEEFPGAKLPCTVDTRYDQKVLLEWFLNFSYLSLNSMCFKLVKRELFTEFDVRFPESHRYAEDSVASAELLFIAPDAVAVPTSLYNYVRVFESFTYSYSLKNAWDVLFDLKDVMGFAEKYKQNIDISNYALGMEFSSLKQLYWTKDRSEKRSEKAKELRQEWRALRRKYDWKPAFHQYSMPFAHQLKISCVYFNVVRFTCFTIDKLKWIPFFKYMT
jgi:glycosyltransferase involved in cell wall biosynthesis